MSNLRDEAELFNNLLAKQYTLSDNATQIPARSISKQPKHSISVTRADNSKIMKNLDPNKAHGLEWSIYEC